MRIAAMLNKSFQGLHSAAYLLGGMSVIGFVISFLRDRTFAHIIGTTGMLDVYIAAFRIPDMLLLFLTVFISTFALIPMFEKRQQESPQALREFIDTIFYFFAVALVIGATVLFIFTPWLVSAIFDSFDPSTQSLVVAMSRIFLVQAMVLGVSIFFTSIIQLERKFIIFALSPIVYNVGIIIGALYLFPVFGLFGLAGGVIIGAILHLGIQLPAIISSNLVPRLRPIPAAFGDSVKTILDSIPRASALSINNITHLVILGFIVAIAEGALSTYYFAENIRFIPLVLVGVAYSIASFPILASLFTKNDLTAFRKTLTDTVTNLLFFILPLVTIIFVLREDIVTFLLKSGAFDATSVSTTAFVLGILVWSTIGYSILMVGARAFYAAHKSLVPLTLFLFHNAVEIVGVYLLIKSPAAQEWALTTFAPILTGQLYVDLIMLVVLVISVAEIVAGAIMLLVLSKTFAIRLKAFFKPLLQHSAASVVLGVCIYITAQITAQQIYSFIPQETLAALVVILVSALIGLVGWGLALLVLRNDEFKLWYKRLLRIV